MSGRETVEFVLRVQSAEAKRAIDGVAESAGKAGAAAKGAQPQVSGLDDKLKGASASAGRAKESMEGVAAALSLVSPEAANAVRQIGMVVAGVKGMAAAGGSLLAVLGPVMLAVGALAAVYSKLSSDLDKANAKMEESAKRADAMAKATGNVSRVEQLSAGTDKAGAVGAMTAQLREEQATINRLRQEIADMEGRTGPITSRQRATLQGQLSGAEVRAGGIERNLAAIEATLSTMPKAVESGAAVGTAKGVMAAAAGEIPEPTIDMLVEGQIFASGGRSSGSAFGPRGADVMAAGLDASLRDALGPTQAVPDAVDVAARQQRMMDLGGAGIGLLQGDVGGLLGMAGPVGMGIGALANVGRQGASGVRDQLEGFTDAIIAGLEALPEILTEVIPDFVGGLVEGLIPALIESFPQLVAAIVYELPVAIARALWDAIRALIPGGDANTSGWGKAANTALDVLSFGQTYRSDIGFGRGESSRISDPTGRYMTGGRGGDIRPDGTSASRTAGGAQIVVQGSVYGSLDTLTRDLDSHLGYGGRGRSAVLGR